MSFKETYLRLREMNSGSRALPYFLIIGAMKAGTTSLFNYLCMHPNVVGSVPKELFYFCSHYDLGESWYRRHFPNANKLRAKRQICGEATPTYLYSSEAAIRAFNDIPNSKIIALLREPAARSVSHYYHRVRTGRESRSINEVFSEERIEQWFSGSCLEEFDNKYFEWSNYGENLGVWMTHFPERQFLILNAEEMYREPQAIFDRVCEFLQIDLCPIRNLVAYNAGPKGRELPHAFQLLQDKFREHADSSGSEMLAQWPMNGPV